MKKNLPIGISDFKELITKNKYYIDKTMLIKDILNSSKVVLIPRPRRFGKTLNMSMLKYFFEKTDLNKEYLFSNFQIWDDEPSKTHFNKYPVIFITFKDVKSNTYNDTIEEIRMLMSRLYLDHLYLRNSKALDQIEKDYFERIINRNPSIIDLKSSLHELTIFLSKHHKENVILLIDEYDTPIQSSYINNFYDKVISFFRGYLSSVLKDNVNLQSGILTGILRVAKEGIFSGLNNLDVFTILDNKLDKYFGVLDYELNEILAYYNIKDETNEFRKWYNGYVFGSETVYNPWSILNAINNIGAFFKPYWINTSGNELIRDIITRSSHVVKNELEDLMNGIVVEKEIYEHIIYSEIENDSNTLWTFLLFSGYLTYTSKKQENLRNIYGLQIPNLEVTYLFQSIIRDWFSHSINNDNYKLMLKSLLKADMETFEEILSEFVYKSFSFFDVGGESPEKVYHSFILGLLISLSNTYELKSNKESGLGRYDVMLIPKDKNKKGFIFEFKKTNKRKNETLEKAANMALEQIIKMDYRQELTDRGVNDILEIGIAFAGKEILMKFRIPKK